MIDGRTDIIQYYSQWLENRFNEGFLYTRNPAYPTKVQKIILDHEHIDAIMFTSKNYIPSMELIKKLDKEYPCLYHYTITAYDKDIEPGVPDYTDRVENIKELSNVVGKEKVFWRYDPVFLTKKYDLLYHQMAFGTACANFGSYVNRSIYSYVNLYEKVKRHMPELEEWTDEKKKEIAVVLGQEAKLYKVPIQTCNCNLDLTEYGVGKSGCITKEIITNVLNLNVKDLKPNGSLGCTHCYPVVNIGEYNTCLNKCRYCYASSDFDSCEKNNSKHDPVSPYLIGHGNFLDEIVERKNQNIISTDLNLF